MMMQTLSPFTKKKWFNHDALIGTKHVTNEFIDKSDIARHNKRIKENEDRREQI